MKLIIIAALQRYPTVYVVRDTKWVPYPCLKEIIRCVSLQLTSLYSRVYRA